MCVIKKDETGALNTILGEDHASKIKILKVEKIK